MTDQQTLATNNATDAADQQTENQAQGSKTYTQEEVDGMMARMRGSLEKKLLKPYQDLGDPEELRQLRVEAEKRQQDYQMKKGEFEKILQDKAAKWETEIQKRDSVIRDYKINTPLLSAAAQFQAVNAEQVKALLSNQVRLNDDGDVEVVDAKGSVRYKDNGQPLVVEDLVQEFLLSNPHFRASTPATTNTKTNVNSVQSGKLDISKLDMRNPDHRKLYAEYRKQNGIA